MHRLSEYADIVAKQRNEALGILQVERVRISQVRYRRLADAVAGFGLQIARHRDLGARYRRADGRCKCIGEGARAEVLRRGGTRHQQEREDECRKPGHNRHPLPTTMKRLARNCRGAMPGS